MQPANSGGRVERLVRHDRQIVIAATGLIFLLAALYTYFGVGMSMTAADMTRMAGPIGDPMSMGQQPVWSLSYAVLMFFMWWIMMIAMMTPSAAPMLLLYTALKKRGPESDKAVMLSLVFLSGYLAAWGAFSFVATGLQWATEATGLSDGPMMTLKSRPVAGAVLLLAGIYQFTGLKEACLRHCRSPAQFLADHARPGAVGAFRTGAHHGLYCLGCCWALMALLFVGGIMNLYWIVGLALYVLAEKILGAGQTFTRVTGGVLVCFGLFVAFT
ncbi:DUF2182 domain-containing protein [Lutimaribacter marinistellae]|uniref:DUF2182 domain-containing protein n=1 Tax=Lutimaribacter marinistellae TaxID=1820329 RepID=A0ABV7TF99_9RHOB